MLPVNFQFIKCTEEIHFMMVSSLQTLHVIKFDDIQKFYKQVKKAGSSNNKFTIINFHVISKARIAVILCESTIPCVK